ncbi:single strand DNA binding protein [Gordonia phage Gsput1]|uniref:DNA binding protein n=1 Tax=Gordonia phage Gsput1 TaxID=1622193 RepID=A0A0E3XA19_9CAUD|nr:single strand DNA binding protein [Gordonia phage Gsput1]AKC03072.1 DNA binding protein [Gordonia phage Gsput1]
MASANTTIVGSLGGDPELRFLPNGTAVASMSVAVTERVKNGDQWEDGETTWWRVNVWRDLAEHVTDSLKKGDQVIVIGRSKLREFEHNGEKRQSLEITADEIGPSLRFATAQPVKAQRDGGKGNGGNRGQSRGNGGNRGGGDPWGSAPAGY